MPKTISHEVQLIVHESENELDESSRSLIQKAKDAAQNAYAKYSDFQVGAALLLENGETVVGSNQENACYPAGLCAERVAFFSAGAQFPNVNILKAVVVAKRREDDHFNGATPCGSCRQVMTEYEHNQSKSITLYIPAENGKVYESSSIDNLLPFKFSEEMLKGNA